MHVLLLLESKMEPIPASVTVKHDWDEICIETQNGHVLGKHVLVEGTEKDISDWLRPFDGVWVGHGAAQFQQFNLMHIK